MEDKKKFYAIEVDEWTYLWLEAMSEKYKSSVAELVHEIVSESFSDEIQDSKNEYR